MRIDLNADIGEGFALDKELMELVTSVNVACGSHAGSPELSIVTAEEARRRGLRVAAHPGYPDREHFGRMSLAADPATWLLKQLRLFPHSAVKPHGAFYDDLLSGCWPNVQFEVPVIGVAGRSSRTL
ncbi:MAG: LamB/YcsF family protein, partial [Armatimonadota bacterium]